MNKKTYKYRFIIAYNRENNTFYVTKRTDMDWCDRSMYFFDKDIAQDYFRKNIKFFSEIHSREKTDGTMKMFYFVSNEDNPEPDTYLY